MASTSYWHNKVQHDGAGWGNPRRSSYDFCIKSSTSDFISAQSDIIPDTTNTEAYGIAIREAIAYVVVEGYTRCIIETKSLLLKKILKGERETP